MRAAATLPLLAWSAMLASCTVAAPNVTPSGNEGFREPLMAVKMGSLGHELCVGSLPTASAARGTCCYPAMDRIRQQVRVAYPALRDCFTDRHDADAAGTVLVAFVIEHDGGVPRACARESSTMTDEPALRCMLDAMRGVRFDVMATDEYAQCGPISIVYPIVFNR